MKCSTGIVACVAASAAVSASATKVTPVQKVIQMLTEMSAKATKERQDEQVMFSAYSQFCDTTENQKSKAISDGENDMEKLSAEILKAKTTAEELSADIAELEEDVGIWQADMKAASDVRSKEKADFSATHTDYMESNSAIERAISVLKKQNYDRSQAESLLEVQNYSHKQVKAALEAFLQQAPVRGTSDKAEDTDNFYNEAPEAHGYEFQSGGVIGMLESLKDKFAEETKSLESDETNASHAFEQMMQDLTGQINGANQTLERRNTHKGRQLTIAAQKTGELSDTTKMKEADEQYLADLKAECGIKADDYTSRQQLRLEEIEAIEKATEILSSGSVSGAADKHLPTMLVQIKSSVKSTSSKQSQLAINAIQDKVAAFLQSKALSLNSKTLALIAEHAENDAFTKVKKMIREMISKLMQEATAETEHHGWCQAELGANKITRDEKSASVESLMAQIEQLKATIAESVMKAEELTAAVADLNKMVAETTAQRTADNKKNTQTVADAKEAQTAVAQALTVLKEFYAKAGEATAFVQVKKQSPGEDAPEIFDTGYNGQQDVKGGVVGMLEVIQSDFVRLESETSATEAEDAAAHKKLMNDTEVDVAVKETEIEHLGSKKTRLESDLATANKDLGVTNEELSAAQTYFDKLKPSCVDTGMTYEERVARREEEMQSLKEAMSILSGEEMA